MIRTRGNSRRKIESSKIVPNSTNCASLENRQNDPPPVVSLRALLERIENLERCLANQQQISTTPAAVHDTSRSLHRILLTDTVSSRMELPALHHMVVSQDIRGTRKIPVRPMHTAQIGDRLTDGRVQTTIMDITPQEIITAHPVTFSAAQALAMVPEKYKVPTLYYVYNLSNKNMHVVSGATAITIRPAHAVTMSLTHAGFRVVY